MKSYYNTGGPMSRIRPPYNGKYPFDEESGENIKKEISRKDALKKTIEEYEEKNSFIRLFDNDESGEESEKNKNSLSLGMENFGLKMIYKTKLVIPYQENPVEYIYKIMKDFGIKKEEELKEKFLIFKKKIICVSSNTDNYGDRKAMADKEEILKDALILGLSNEHIYDFNRPVIFTEANLKRTVELYDMEGFYGYF